MNEFKIKHGLVVSGSIDATGTVTATNFIGSTGAYLPLTADSSYPLSGPLYLLSPNDPKLILQTTSGDTSDWNYINFVGRDTVRDGYVGTDADGDIQVYSDKNASSVQLTSSGILLNGGNVGIGTTSPVVKLQVEASNVAAFFKSATNTVPLSVFTTGNTLSTIGFKGSATTSEYHVRVGSDSNDFVAFTNNSEKMRITSAGNVGIGTTVPGLALSIRNGSYALPATSGTAQNGSLRVGQSGGLVLDQGTGLGGAWLQATNSSDLSLSYPLFLNPNGGNVGIGTTSPVGKLSVREAGTGVYFTRFAGDDGTTGPVIAFANDSTKSIIAATGDGIIFRTRTVGGAAFSGSEKMRITSGGNVGIGTTSPDDRLDVIDGNAQMVFGTASSDRSYIQFKHNAVPVDGEELVLMDFSGYNDASQSTRYVILTSKAEDVTDGSEDGSLTFQTMAGGTATQSLTMRSGQVGIGTASPLRKLHVVGNFAVNAAAGEYYGVNITGGEGANPNILIGDWHNSSANLTWDSVNNFLRIDSQHSTSGAPIVFSGNDAATEYARFTATGNLGIGTTSPGAKLDVGGTGRFDGTLTVNGEIYGRTSTLYPGLGGLGFYSLVPYLENANQGGLKIKVQQGNSLVDSLTLDSSQNATFAGNVGIGTANIGTQSNLYLGAINSSEGGQITLQKATGGTLAAHIDAYTTGGNDYMRILSGGDTSTTAAPFVFDLTNVRVGIGTTSPESTLHIKTSVDNSVAQGLVIERSANTDKGYINYNGGGFQFRSTDGDPIVFGQVSNERMRIDSSGATSFIGSSSLSTAVASIQHYSSNGYLYIKGGAGGLILGDDSTASRIQIEDNSNIRFETAGSEAMRINSSGNVGIGTTNPELRLDVIGNASNTNTFFGVTVETSTFFRPSSNLAGISFGFNSSDGYIWSAASGGKLHFGTRLAPNNKINMTLDSAGNVGIGTTSPDAKLEVVGSNALRIHDGTDQGSIFFRGDRDDVYIKESNYQLLFGAPSGMVFELDTNNNDGDLFNVTHRNNSRLYINGASGKVGIGTTAPSVNLEVASIDTTGTPAIIRLTSRDISVIDEQELSEIQFYNSDADGAHVSAYIKNIAAETYGRKGQLAFGVSTTNSTNAVEALRINENGNVGIGTTSPAYKLDVSGTARISNDIALGAFNEITGVANDNLVISVDKDNLSGSSSIDFQLDGATSALFINNSRYVGIGTTSPSRQLEVSNTGNAIIRIAGDSDNDVGETGDAVLEMTTDAGGHGWSIRSANIGGGTGDFKVNTFISSVESTKLLIDRDGNVGIGTTSPLKPLQVDGAIAAQRSGVEGVYARRELTGSGHELDVPSGYHSLLVKNNGSEQLRITSAGNVGIGTTNPGNYKLYVNGGQFGTLLKGGDLGTGSDVVRMIKADSSVAMLVRGDGNVGIGTASPSYSLDVSGIAAFGNGTGQLNAGSDGTSPYVEATGTNNLRFITAGVDQIVVNPAGEVAIGIPVPTPGTKLDVAGNVNVQGTLTAVVKSFTIDHPTKEGKKLQYGVLEGPEHSVYVRGRLTNENTIVLPDHWYGLVDEDTITVNLTCIGRPQDLWVQEVNAYNITVGSEQENINCFYTVFAERKDVDKLIVEFDKV